MQKFHKNDVAPVESENERDENYISDNTQKKEKDIVIEHIEMDTKTIRLKNNKGPNEYLVEE